MAYGRNVFRAPSGALAPYAWQVNHSDEEEVGRRRNIETTAPTSNVGLVMQQGSDGPMILRFTGTILHASQFAAMRAYFNLSRTETIIFTDFAGDSYEVVITAFNPTRKRTLRNPRDVSIHLHYWTYTIELTVVRVLTGAWA